jgi:hypothetical protein
MSTLPNGFEIVSDLSQLLAFVFLPDVLQNASWLQQTRRDDDTHVE